MIYSIIKIISGSCVPMWLKHYYYFPCVCSFKALVVALIQLDDAIIIIKLIPLNSPMNSVLLFTPAKCSMAFKLCSIDNPFKFAKATAPMIFEIK